MFIGTANFISSFILENVEKQTTPEEINITEILGSRVGVGVGSNRGIGVISGLSSRSCFIGFLCVLHPSYSK